MTNSNEKSVFTKNINGNQSICHLVFCGLLLCVSAKPVSANKDSHRNAYISIGKAEVKANELVIGQPSTYPVDYKLSHLIWETSDIAMLVAGLNFSSGKDSTVNIETKFALTEGDGVMDDYDWQYVGLDWTDWSHHEDTTLSEASSLDINLASILYRNAHSDLSLVIGYKWETWAWEASWRHLYLL